MFQGHLDYLQNEIGLTQDQVTMALRNLTTIDLLHFIMCEDMMTPMNRTRCKSICWGHNHMRLHRACVHTTWFWELSQDGLETLLLGSHHLKPPNPKMFRTCPSLNLKSSNSGTDSQWNLSHGNGQRIGTGHYRMCGADGPEPRNQWSQNSNYTILHELTTFFITRHVLPVRHHKVVLIGWSRERAMSDDESQRQE